MCEEDAQNRVGTGSATYQVSKRRGKGDLEKISWKGRFSKYSFYCLNDYGERRLFVVVILVLFMGCEGMSSEKAHDHVAEKARSVRYYMACMD